MKTIVKVIPGQCIGAASCVAIAPQIFQLVNGVSTVTSQGTDADEDAKMSAAKACPVNAIEVWEVDENGNEKNKLWPLE